MAEMIEERDGLGQTFEASEASLGHTSDGNVYVKLWHSSTSATVIVMSPDDAESTAAALRAAAQNARGVPIPGPAMGRA